MSIIRTVKRENPFVQLDKTSLEDVNLSWKAKGILAYLISRPDNWKIYIKDLQNRARDGRDSVSAGLKELSEAGYILRKRKHGEDGRFAGWEYEVYEFPQALSENGKSEYGKTENGLSENGKSNTNNNNLTNNKLSNTTVNNKGPDSLDLIADRFADLRSAQEGRVVYPNPKDYQTIAEIIAQGIPTKKIIELLERCFKEFEQREPNGKIKAFSYCKDYILDHYNALQINSGGNQDDKHFRSSERFSGNESKVSGTDEAIRGTQKQRLIGEDGEIQDTECNF